MGTNRQFEEMDQLFDQVLCGIIRYEIEPARTVLACNRHGAEIFGYQSAEALLEAVRQGRQNLVYPYDRQTFQAQEAKCLARTRPVNYGHRILRRDKTLSYILGSLTRYTGPTGHTVIQCIFNDAGSRVSAQSDGWRRYLSRPEMSDKPIVLLADAPDHRCRQIGTWLAEHYQVVPACSEEEIGAALHHIHGQLDAVVAEASILKEQGYRLIGRLKHSALFSDLPILALRTDGKVSVDALLELGASSVLDMSAGQISEPSYGRHALHLQLQNLISLHTLAVQNKAISTVADTMPGGILLLRVDAKHNTSMVFASEGVVALTGYTQGEFDQQFYQKNAILRLINPNDLARIRMKLGNAVQEKGPVEVACRILRRDGQDAWVYLRTLLLPGEDGDVLQVTVTPSTEGESNYRRTLDDAFCGILVNDLDTGELLYENNEAAALAGTDSANIWKCFAEGSISADAFTTLRLSNKQTGQHLSVSARQVNWNGVPAQVTYLVDDTERVEKQEELHRLYQQELSRHESLDARSLGTAVYNMTGRRFEKIDLRDTIVARYSKDETLEQLVEQVAAITPDPAHQALLREQFLPEKLEARWQRKDMQAHALVQLARQGGSLCWVEIRANLLKMPDTGERMAFFYMTDVDEQVIMRKVQNAALQQDTEFVWCVEVGSGKLRAVSQRWPLQSDQVIALSVFMEGFLPFVAQEDRADVQTFWNLDNMKNALTQQTQHVLIYRMSTPEDTVLRWKKSCAFYLDASRNMICVTHTDVNDLHEAQEAQERRLEQALEEANRANRAKSDFLSRMSHDIRTPMNAVLGMCQLALSDFENKAMVLDYLHKIQDSGTYLLAIINDILDMSSIEQGKFTLRPEPISIRACMEFVQMSMQAKLQQKHLTFLYDEQDVTVRTVLLDKSHFQQILFNLLSNAVKFTPDNGRIHVTLRQLEQDGKTVRVRISVADSGIGISPEMRKRVFLPFERGSSDEALAQEGTGLGLSIVQNLVSLMDGTIWTEDSPEGGACFVVEMQIPISQQEQRTETAPAVPAYDFTGRRLLLAEDHPINVEVARRLLEQVGWQVDTAADGRQALERFSSEPTGTYDLILMDIRMPVMDGLEATRRIRAMERPDGQTISIIAMTADAFLQSITAMKEAGMDEYISKPLMKEDMYRIMDGVLKKGRRGTHERQE